MDDVYIPSRNGKEFKAYTVMPKTDLPAAAVIVIQEIFGVNDVMRDICLNIAQLGYIAICPDLFWRQEPDVQLTDKKEEDLERAFELYNGFDIDKGVEDLQDTLKYIRNHENCSGYVGNVGFCLGGKLSYLMSTRTTTDCSIGYYGVGIEDMLDEQENIKRPILLHIAEKDQFVTTESQNKIMRTLNDNQNVSAYIYNGVDHAFARPNGEHFNAEAATLANVRTADFLARYLTIR